MVLTMNNYSVLMFDGSIKSIAEVRQGDILMGPDSGQRIVKNIETYEDEAWEIRPCKGEDFILGGENYLCLQKVGNSKCCIDLHVNDFANQSKHFQNNYKLYRSAAKFSLNTKPTIDSHLLGILIGDACFRSTPIKLTNADDEVLKYVTKTVENLGLTSVIRKSGCTNCYDLFIGSNGKRNSILKSELEKLGLWNKLGYQKFIPNIYKLGSIEVRAEILAGLIDSDGTLSKNNSIRYDTTSKQLAEDVAFVARSLGLACIIGNPRKRNINWRPCYTLCIFGDFGQLPLLVTRKTPQERRSKISVLRTGVSIKRHNKPAVYYKLEFTEGDPHYLKSDFMVMKGGEKYAI